MHGRMRPRIARAFAGLVGAMAVETAAISQEAVVPAAPAPATAVSVTWHNRIATISRERCARCHHEGGAGPFALLTPDDFSGAATMISEAVESGIMPPWVASAASGPFRYDGRLRPDEKQDLLTWLKAGCPVGVATAPEVPFVPQRGWGIGEPDLVVPIAEAVAIPPSGVVDYLKVSAPTGLDRVVWVQAIQILCEHPTICHHVLARVSYPGTAHQEFVDFYLPGSVPTIYPDGMAMMLRPGAVIEFDLHYTPDGVAHRERTSIGFKFAKGPPQQRVRCRILDHGGKLSIPPGAANHEVSYEFRFPADTHIRRLTPHMHLRGKSARIEIVAPDGAVTTPIELPQWLPDWQFSYEFMEPLFIPKGTLIRGIHVFDNSKANPFNPDPTARVRNGPQIWDEMAGVFIEMFSPVDSPLVPIAERDRVGGEGDGR